MTFKICPYCGFEVVDDVNFCPNCGKPMAKEDKDRKGNTKESMFQLDDVGEFKNNTKFQKMYQSLSPEEAGRDIYPKELFNFGFNFAVILKIIGVVGFIICLVIAMPMSGLDRSLEMRRALKPLLVGLAILVVCFILSFIVKSLGKLFKKIKK